MFKVHAPQIASREVVQKVPVGGVGVIELERFSLEVDPILSSWVRPLEHL